MLHGVEAISMVTFPFLAAAQNAALVSLGLAYAITLADMVQYMVRISAEVENTVRHDLLQCIFSDSLYKKDHMHA